MSKRSTEQGRVAYRRLQMLLGLGLTILLVWSSGCGVSQQSLPQSPLGGRVNLVGAGASFPALIYQSWFIALNRQIPDLRVNYQSLGSGAGIEQFIAETLDFGGSDVAMTDEEIAQVERGVMLLPMTAGSVVLIYNLPDVSEGLQISREALVGILLGEITHWSDPRIRVANPQQQLPDLPITVVHRADGSGTTEVLTTYLSAISPSWQAQIGAGKSVEWPRASLFVGSKGNEGVTAQVLQTPGSIGYVDYSYGFTSHLAMAALENQSGQFLFPSADSALASLASVPLPENLRAFITDPPGEASYPIVTYTWLLAYRQYPDPRKALALEMMIEYCLTQGQTVAPILGYIPLPLSVRQQVAALADQLTPDYHISLDSLQPQERFQERNGMA